MTTKQQVLDLLEQNRGSFLSGEDLRSFVKWLFEE